MRKFLFFLMTVLFSGVVFALADLEFMAEQAGPGEACLEISLTGTQGGPPLVNGLAGAGTLVRYGTRANQCSDLQLQFDVGRGTSERLSQLDSSPLEIDAVFLTHLHSDHTEGLPGLLLYRWHFLGESLDLVCSDDAVSEAGTDEWTLSCRALVEHSADSMIAAGEIAQRRAENPARHEAGPAALANVVAIPLPLPEQPGAVVWESGDVVVTAIATTHIAGSLAYRVDTPAGSVVIGGDAGNSKRQPPRGSSTSESVEALARGADVLVHSAIHPAFSPGSGSSFPAAVYYRQSNVEDLGALAERAGIAHLVLTHLIPAIESPSHGPYRLPGGAMSADDYATSVGDSGYHGNVHVGRDLYTLRLPISP